MMCYSYVQDSLFSGIYLLEGIYSNVGNIKDK